MTRHQVKAMSLAIDTKSHKRAATRWTKQLSETPELLGAVANGIAEVEICMGTANALLVRSAGGQVACSGMSNAAIASRCSLTSRGSGRQRQRGQHLRKSTLRQLRSVTS